MLSNYEVENHFSHNISFSYFCGLHIVQVATGHSSLSRFRSMMTKVKSYEPLLKKCILKILWKLCVIIYTEV
ncbi:transposase [Bacteroidota bacterium]